MAPATPALMDKPEPETAEKEGAKGPAAATQALPATLPGLPVPTVSKAPPAGPQKPLAEKTQALPAAAVSKAPPAGPQEPPALQVLPVSKAPPEAPPAGRRKPPASKPQALPVSKASPAASEPEPAAKKRDAEALADSMRGLLKRGKGQSEEEMDKEEEKGAGQGADKPERASKIARREGTQPEIITPAPAEPESRPEMPADGRTVIYRRMQITNKAPEKMWFRIFAPAGVYPKEGTKSNDWTRQFGTKATPPTEEKTKAAFAASCDLVDQKWETLAATLPASGA